MAEVNGITGDGSVFLERFGWRKGFWNGNWNWKIGFAVSLDCGTVAKRLNGTDRRNARIHWVLRSIFQVSNVFLRQILCVDNSALASMQIEMPRIFARSLVFFENSNSNNLQTILRDASIPCPYHQAGMEASPISSRGIVDSRIDLQGRNQYRRTNTPW